MRKKQFCFISASIMIFFLVYNAVAFEVSASTNDSYQNKLPEYLLKFSEYLSKGNKTELFRIRNQMVKQLQIKEDTIKATSGAVLHPASALDLNDVFMQSVNDWSHTMYSIHGGIIGQVLDPENIAGSYDYEFAELDSFNWNLDPNNPMGGEAIIWGDMGTYLNTANLYICGTKGPYTGQDPPGAQYWHNYINLFASQYENGPWDWIGYASMTGDTHADYYVGTVYDSWYQYIGICTWYPIPYPIYCDPDPSSCLVDSVLAQQY